MHSEIAFILDRSGSMQSMRHAAIDGFNQFLRDQQAAADNPSLTLVLFDHEILTLHDSVPVAEICLLDEDTFVPRGSTALLDAIGDTIDRLGKRFSSLPPQQQPQHVAVAILTDGEENSSVRFTWQDIAKRIKHQSENYSWEFLFLGAGIDAIATAAKINIAAHNSATYLNDGHGIHAASQAASYCMSSSRKIRRGDATARDRELHARSMDEVVREEDQKRRGK
ncbi:MAG: hypothetical protein V4733_07030 [Verrucomicrobiota bacterium]